MCEMITPVANKPHIRAVITDIFDPGGAKSRITVRTSKLTGAVKCDFESFKINILISRCGISVIKGLYRIYFTFVHTVTNSVATHVFYLPAVFTARRAFTF